MKYVIAYFAYLGILSLLWTILPGWVIGIIATVGIFFIPIVVDLMGAGDAKVGNSSNLENMAESSVDLVDANVPRGSTKPTIYPNDDLENYRFFANRTLFEIDVEMGLMGVRVDDSLLDSNSEKLLIETQTEILLFPFVSGFDMANLNGRMIGACIFKIVLIYSNENSSEMEECICFGHPDNF